MITGPRDTLKRARKLRSEMALQERLRWRELRLRPGGFKFRRQHPAGIYVLDFYCPAARLAIEVDGFAHDGATAAKAARSHFLRSQRVATVRVPAKIILQDVANPVVRIVEVWVHRVNRLSGVLPVPLHHPAGGSPPPVGEEL